MSGLDPEGDEIAPPWAQEQLRAQQLPSDHPVERIDAALARIWPDLSRARLQGLIGQQRLCVDGQPVLLASAKAKPGGVYRLRLPPPAPPSPQPEDIALDIAFEDQHLIVVNKPAGMAAHPAAGSLTGTLVHALLHHCGASLSGIGGVARPGIVHRIDKDTTGLMVVAKTDAAHAGLAKLFAAHDLDRVYYAVTRGATLEREGEIESRLLRSEEDRRKQKVLRDAQASAGRYAHTRYWTIERFGQLRGSAAGKAAAALMECRLETGRTHQIRAHLAHLGAPLIGDPLYGKDRGLKAAGSGEAVDAAVSAAASFPRQALHAGVLGFRHPITNEALRFSAPWPQDMAHLLAALRRL